MPNPLAGNPPDIPVPALSGWEKVAARVSKHAGAATDKAEKTEIETETTTSAAPLSGLGKVIEEFEIEVRKSMERANDILLATVGSWRARSPSPGVEEKASAKNKEKDGKAGRGRKL